MSIKRIIGKILAILYTKLLLLKINIGYKVFGIGFVSHKISHVPSELILTILRKYGATVSSNVNIKDCIQLDNSTGVLDTTNDFSNLIIGEKCYIGKGVFFDLPNRIILGDEVVISAGVKILTHEDCGDRIMSRWYPRKSAKVCIGKGTWIGADAIILSGVQLGECCVVGAGSVVTKSFPAYSVIAGVPAKLKKRLENNRENKAKSA